MIRINSIDYSGSIVDGPGIRTVLYVQGCDQACPGCQNTKTWKRDGGTEVLIDDLVIELREKVTNKKLTISGGEPLLQADEVLSLLDSLSEFNVALYTGYELENVPKEILEKLDYIKVGKYIEESRSTTLSYVGSSNQCFLKLKGD